MADVTEIFTQQQQYARDIGQTVSGLLSVLSYLASIEVTPAEVPQAQHTFYDAVNSLSTAIIGLSPTEPTIAEPAINPPTAPQISISNVVDNITVPDFNVAPPTVNIPTTPTMVLPGAPTSAPDMNAVSIPTAPELVIPPVPALSTINLPSAPVIALPEFITTVPTASFSAPSNNFTWAEDDYSSTMLDTAKAKLLADMQNGGYGIEVTDETRLWDRMTERELAQANAETEEIERTFAMRRFPVPPGTMYQAMERARQTAQDAASTASRDIAVRRSELLVQNRQFTLEQVKQMEGMLMNYRTARLERLLNAARYSAQFAIDFFHAQRDAYVARLEGYKAEAAVFADLVRAQVEKLNIYRATLEGERLKGELDKTRLEAYRSQLAGLETQISLYRTRMQAAEVEANVGRTRVEAYRASVDAYVAQVRGKEIEFHAFEAAVRGEETKARMYESQARGYAATVEGARARAEIANLKVRAASEVARAQTDLYNADTNRFRAQLEGTIRSRELTVDLFRSKVDAYRARAGAAGEISRLGVENYRANSEDFRSTLRYNLDRAALALKVGESNRDFKVNLTKTQVDYYVNLVASALSGINAIASQSKSE